MPVSVHCRICAQTVWSTRMTCLHVRRLCFSQKQASILSFFSRQPDAAPSSSSAPVAGEKRRLSSPPLRGQECGHADTDSTLLVSNQRSEKELSTEKEGQQNGFGSVRAPFHSGGDPKGASPKRKQPRLSVCKREDDTEADRQRDGCTPSSRDRGKAADCVSRTDNDDLSDAKRHRVSVCRSCNHWYSQDH